VNCWTPRAMGRRLPGREVFFYEKLKKLTEGVGVEPHRREPSPMAGYKSAAPAKMRDAFRSHIVVSEFWR
jgi:hypothetical protein